MDRRDFLKNSGSLAAAAMFSSALTACSAGRNSSGLAEMKNIPDAYDTDLLVVGGGPAGTCAAIAAARMGVKTIIMDSGNCLGGMATKGLVGPFMTCYDRYGEQMVIKGLFEEIVGRMVDRNWAIHPENIRWESPYTAWIKAGHDHLTPFSPEGLKYILETMCIEAGVKILYHTSFVETIMKGRSVAGAVVLRKQGLGKIHARMVIDATGDGDVAVSAGVPFSVGCPERGGKIQPSSLFLRINNVDSEKLEADVYRHLPEFKRVNNVSYRALHWNVAQAEANGEWDIDRKSVNLFKSVGQDEWVINSTRIRNIDATVSESLTEGEIEGRRQVQELMNFFRKYVAGCEKAALMCSASTLGIRESRHIEGEYILKAEDLVNGVVPDDSILLASNSVDVHGGGATANSSVYTVINAAWYGVPYRCLLPLEAENLLVAGRCLSANSDAAGAVRVMPPVMAMGHAAGVAAALSLRGGIVPRRLDAEDLRSELKKQKAFL
jgi:hypothetical protein